MNRIPFEAAILGGGGAGGVGAGPRVTRGGVTHTRIPGLYRNYAARKCAAGLGAPHISILPEVRSSAAPNSDVNSLCHTSYIHGPHRLNMEEDIQSLFGLHVT
jgi:hypothetical protein